MMPRKPNAEPTNEPRQIFNIYLPPDDARRFADLCTELGGTRSDAIRWLMDKAKVKPVRKE